MTAILVSFAIALVLNGAFFAITAARVVTDLSYSLTYRSARGRAASQSTRPVAISSRPRSAPNCWTSTIRGSYS